jgi:CSLREA domain-containing protein
MKKFLAGAVAVVAMLAAPSVAGAVNINVNTTADEYDAGPDCSLREAITAAQTNAAFGGCAAGFGSDTITLPAGTYKITRAGADEDSNATGDFDITGANDLEIRGAPGARVIVDANGIDRAFDKSGASSAKFTSLRIMGGKLTLIEDGGGVRVSTGSASFEEVTVDGNETAQQGGGIAVYSDLLMVNSTVSGNKANGNGGGIYAPGGSSLNVRSSTIYGNVADADENGIGAGGGFAESGALSVNFTNVLNSNNSGTPVVDGELANDCYSGPFFFPRYTLQSQPLGPSECLVGFASPTNVQADDTKVDPVLRYNGGTTPTHALLPGSPAIGKGGTAAPDECPGVDQNGYGRPAGSCDIGAVQFRPEPKLVITKILPKKKVIKRKKARAITTLVQNVGTGPATGVKVCLVLNRAAKQGLKRKGKLCRKSGTVGVGAVKRVKIKLAAKPKAKKRAYPVRTRVTGVDFKPIARQFRVRVK